MNRLIKLACIFSVILAISLSSFTAQAQTQNRTTQSKSQSDDGIDAFFAEFYKDNWKSDDNGERYIYLSEKLSKLIMDDYKSNVFYLSDGTPVHKDTPTLDFDPFLNAQDTDPKLRVEVVKLSNQAYSQSGELISTKAAVKVYCFDSIQEMTYTLVCEKGAWCVDNVVYLDNGKEGFNLQKHMTAAQAD